MQNSALPLDDVWPILFFPVLWIAISGVLSLLSGWSSLATRFRANAPGGGETFGWVSGAMGFRFFPVNYGHCLRVTSNPTGMGLSVLLPFRAFCPPLFIPWREVESVENGRIFFASYAVIRLRDHWSTIKIRGNAGNHLLREFGRSQINAGAQRPRSGA
jgi:hypothetical protein